MTLTAAVLAVGSELLAGQTVNRDAAWLSDHLFSLGIDTKAHLTVDDVEAEILSGLRWIATQADLLFVTGGLGPTSDDLTRNAVAAWATQPLTFDEGSWEHIKRRFALFSRTVPETNRQQCYFPASAKVLENRAGTANGFRLEANGKEVWVLPGPPAEVEALWQDHLQAALASRIPQAARKRLRMWRTIGKGESHLAELVTPLLGHHEGLDVAYRAHAPFVELKLRFPEADAEKYAPLCTDITQALRPWLYEMDHECLPAELAEMLAKLGSVDIYDGVTQGQLSEMLTPHLRCVFHGHAPVSLATGFDSHEYPQAFVEQALELDSDAGVSLAVAGVDEAGHWAAGVRRGEDKRVEEHPSPYFGDAMRSRNLKAIAALAIKAWHGLLAEGVH